MNNGQFVIAQEQEARINKEGQLRSVLRLKSQASPSVCNSCGFDKSLEFSGWCFTVGIGKRAESQQSIVQCK